MSDADPSTVNHVRSGRSTEALCGHAITSDDPSHGSTCNACVRLLVKAANGPVWVQAGAE